jgi:hypothetical protein
VSRKSLTLEEINFDEKIISKLGEVMTNGQLLTIILSLGIPMLTGFGWIIRVIFQSQKELAQIKLDVQGNKLEISNMRNELRLEISSTRNEVLKEIRVLDARISHIEGYLIGSTQRTGTQT